MYLGSIVRWGSYPGFPRRTHSNHKGPYVRELGLLGITGNQVTVDTEGGGCGMMEVVRESDVMAEAEVRERKKET